jgi:hypothetical protein
VNNRKSDKHNTTSNSGKIPPPAQHLYHGEFQTRRIMIPHSPKMKVEYNTPTHVNKSAITITKHTKMLLNTQVTTYSTTKLGDQHPTAGKIPSELGTQKRITVNNMKCNQTYQHKQHKSGPMER